MRRLRHFREIWLIDFEYVAAGGNCPRPVCLVAREFRTGRLIRLWEHELLALPKPPYPLDAEVLIVAYHASAELGCHAALGWAAPARVLDLEAEFRCMTSGLYLEHGRGLIGALVCHGLDAMEGAQKDAMRDLILAGGPWSVEERRRILDYCQADVDSLARLMPAMATRIDLAQALHRGRFSAAVARMEWYGIPIDVATLGRLLAAWETIKEALIRRVDAHYGVYEGTTFKIDRFAAWLTARGIPWPRLGSGQLATDDDTFRTMAKGYPEVATLRELRHSVGQLRLNDLQIGVDGRNRAMISQFCSKTGRNQPSNSKFIFGPSVWLRGLIRPEPGRALAYIDWNQQEFGIAAKLSGDSTMIEAYLSGDPYMEFAKQAGAVPPGGTKETHKRERGLYKQAVLATQYGQGCRGLAQRIDRTEVQAEALLKAHRRTYTRFWAWSDRCVDHARLYGWLPTVYGWRVHIDGDAINPRSLRNFPMQANGAEMMRLACILATEAGIRVIAPIHDALLIEAPVAEIDQVTAITEAFMAEASRTVLDGFTLRTDPKIIRYPERYRDEERGGEFWDEVMRLVDSVAPDQVHEPSSDGRVQNPTPW